MAKSLKYLNQGGQIFNGCALPIDCCGQLFKKKPELALELIDRSLHRGYRPGIVLIDAGYGNNVPFLLSL
jgi:SRSO17 transposase